MKSEKPEIGKAPRFSSTRWSYEFYTALFLSGRTPALPDALRAVIVNINTFPISGAKVLLLFDICKFFGKKMQKYVVKHKKRPFLRGPFSPLGGSTDYAGLSGCSSCKGYSDPFAITVVSGTALPAAVSH